jgi:hypothetical protein
MYLDHTYLHHFLDRHSSWLEESVANARGYREFCRRAAIISKHQAEEFRSFLVSWMKTQSAGYRDYDQWNGRSGLTNGQSAITTHLHESLRHWRGGKIESDAGILDLYREAEYSQIPIIRIPDARLPGLRSARPFPKAHGLQVSVFSNDHPPPHIHVDFLNGDVSVRVGWPSLQPLKYDRGLSRTERRNLTEYLKLHEPKILKRLRIVFNDRSLPVALR